MEHKQRDIEPRLKKWRLKERKPEFHEKIQSLAIKELLPKTVIENKMKELDDCKDILEEKEGDKRMEDKLGIKLANRFDTIQFFDCDFVSLELPFVAKKEKTHEEKKKERETYEKKVEEEA